jgi:hypothetical protein
MVNDCCKDVALLQKLGSFGSTFLDNKRFMFMILNTLICSLTWILTIVAMAGSSVDNETVENCAWTIQENQGYTLYYGTYRFTSEISSSNYDDCPSELSDVCNDCETAGVTANNCTVFTFIFTFFFIALSVLRMFPSWDAIMFKTTFIVMSLVNILVMIIGMGSWDDQCADSHIVDGGK